MFLKENKLQDDKVKSVPGKVESVPGILVLKTENSCFLTAFNQMVLKDIENSLRMFIWRCKTLLNFICLPMKFHNYHHAMYRACGNNFSIICKNRLKISCGRTVTVS